MARVPQNRQTRVVHECPICGRESPPHEGSAEEATEHLVNMGWSWTSRLDGGAWHLVCQLHRNPGEPRTLYENADRGEKYGAAEA
jgi:hypothetical protein